MKKGESDHRCTRRNVLETTYSIFFLTMITKTRTANVLMTHSRAKPGGNVLVMSFKYTSESYSMHDLFNFCINHTTVKLQ